MKTWLFAIIVMSSCAGGFCAQCTNLLANGDFESGAAGWPKPNGKGVWSFADGCGRGSSRALSLSVANPKGETWQFSEKIVVEPGTVYRLGGWIKEAADSKLNLTVGVLWIDANEQRIDQLSAMRVTDNDIKQDGWCRVELETPPLPLEAAFCKVFAGVSGKRLGTAFVDDLVFEQAASTPGVTRLYTSAYRDMAATGEVRLAASYFASPVKYPVAALRGTFEIVTANGVRRIPAVLADGVARAAINAAALREGTHPIAFELATADGRTLGRRTVDFTKVRELPKRRVAIDDKMRTVVDGKPFFPLGMYWPKVTQEKIDVYTNSPFNFIMPYNDIRRESLDLCHRAGLMVACHLSGCGVVAKIKPEDRAAYEETHRNADLRRLMDHPAVLAWYLADELPLQYADILATRHRNFHRIDPDHPTWIVLCRPNHVRPMMDGYDIIGVDPYPIGNRGWPKETTIALAGDWTRCAVEQTFGLRPMWIVPQAFSWEWHPLSGTERIEKRMPTRAELSSMTWQSVAAGANGICYYSFGSLISRLKGTAFDAAWADVVAVAREVKAEEPMLLSDPGPDISGVPTGLLARTWKSGKTHHLLVVNATNRPVRATLRVPFAAESVDLDLAPCAHAISRFP